MRGIVLMDIDVISRNRNATQRKYCENFRRGKDPSEIFPQGTTSLDKLTKLGKSCQMARLSLEIARHLVVDYRTIHRWLPRNSELRLPHHNGFCDDCKGHT